MSIERGEGKLLEIEPGTMVSGAAVENNIFTNDQNDVFHILRNQDKMLPSKSRDSMNSRKFICVARKFFSG